ncbi:MAG: DUF6265 family protein [Candidatus Zixiibacteriota bacterium]
MSIRSLATLVFVVTIVFACAGVIMAEQDKTQKIHFEDFSGMVGHWVGPGFGGTCEETWMPASGGSMLGTFKLIKDGKTIFSELMCITFEDNGPVLKVKHFSGEFVAWEEKDEYTTFAFTEKSGDSIVFSGLHYILPDANTMEIIVDMKSKDGSIHQETISCKRQK